MRGGEGHEKRDGQETDVATRMRMVSGAASGETQGRESWGGIEVQHTWRLTAEPVWEGCDRHRWRLSVGIIGLGLFLCGLGLANVVGVM